ncbi:hypothetical protein SLS56_008770 [Neofusicoccum ribis]|uniref:Uncharacterized protein n=1 Tax=Neofusicoccum ribis TaxID=45134 RepID=A0ABR3SKQ4_9PEZI
MHFHTAITVVLGSAGFSLGDIVSVSLPSGFFEGPQTGIGSWFRSTNDGTNGNSWCSYPYYDSDPVFAVAGKYCGLEAKVKDSATGKTKLMYIGDAFDDAWVRVIKVDDQPLSNSANASLKTPASIDIMIDAFSEIHGSPNNDKNDVINDVEWELTGNSNTEFAAS